MNDWSPSGAFVTPQVRSLRKGNSDHVAIAVDVDPGSTSRIEDEEDDKGNYVLLNLCTGFCCFQQHRLKFNSGIPTFLLQSMVSNPSQHPQLSQDLLDL